MAFHQVRFPLDVALGARGGPTRQTDIVTLVSGGEERNSRWADSRRRFDAGYGIKSLADMQVVLNFFEERRGRFHSFLWRDALDFSSAAPNFVVSPTDQTLGAGDGSLTQFQLVKRYGASFDPYDRSISKPDSTSVRLAFDALEVNTSDYSLNDLTGIVTFATAPGSGVSITAGFEFDIPVRFESDRLDVEISSFDAANVPNIQVIEVRE